MQNQGRIAPVEFAETGGLFGIMDFLAFPVQAGFAYFEGIRNAEPQAAVV